MPDTSSSEAPSNVSGTETTRAFWRPVTLFQALFVAFVPVFMASAFLDPLTVAGIAAVVSTIGVWLLVRRIRRFQSLAARIARRDLEARLQDPGPDELGQLGTALNEMAESLWQAREKVSQLDAQRWRLLADITHELATPLTSIRGYTETLQDPDVPISEDEKREFLVHIQEESRRMELLIQDLFEMVRLESGKVRLRTEELDWAALVRHTVARFRPKLAKAGLTLKLTSELTSEFQEDRDEAWVEADGRRMEQVLENLLTNAVRYVPSGCEVLVILSRHGDVFRLTVEDDGPGFPEEDLELVFDRFYRGNLTESFPGSGLGLAIVKEIVERHDGRVWAANRSPQGAILTVELPRAGRTRP